MIKNFITLEGIDGTGKSTQIKRLKAFLNEKKIPFLMTYEPGGTIAGTALRRVIMDIDPPIGPETELLLYYADRNEHLRRKIRPALKQGKLVFSDRYFDATYAYQVGGRGIPVETVNSMNAYIVGDTIPGTTFLFDCEPEAVLSRIQNRRRSNRFDTEKRDFFRRVREYYLRLAQKEPQRFVRIDSNRGIEEVAKSIQTSLKDRGIIN